MPHGDFEFEREQFLEKPLPSSSDSERVILGAVLLDNTVLPQAIELLKPNDFYSPLHRRVFRAMIRLFELSEPIEPILIGEELKREGQLEAIGGVATITNLTYGLPHFSNITEYCKKVRDLSQLRDLIKTCNEVTSTALAEDDTPENVLQFAQAKINEVCTRDDKEGFVGIGKLSQTALQKVIKVAELREKGLAFSGLRTGLNELDSMTGGLQKTDLIIIAARPAMGKSSLVANIGVNVGKFDPEAVTAIFSLEMSKEQYTDRILCSMAGVDLHRYRNGYLTRDEWGRLAAAADELSEHRIEIDDNSSVSPLEMRSKLMRLRAEKKRLDLVAVDFLQRMVGTKRTENRQQEVSNIVRELKSIAKDFEVPLVAISSLSRAPENRNPPKPRLSDLRESGDIESEADIVVFVYRDEYYHQTESNAGIAELLIEKHRHGPTGNIKLAFMKEYTKFGNLYEG